MDQGRESGTVDSRDKPLGQVLPLQSSSIYSRIQESLDSQKRKHRDRDEQMVPEKLVEKNQYVTFSHEIDDPPKSSRNAGINLGAGMNYDIFSAEATLSPTNDRKDGSQNLK